MVFTTPEALQNKNWRKILLDENFKKRLCLIACDEAHCISDW
jgi:superfamily II DNA helicase RecQ